MLSKEGYIQLLIKKGLYNSVITDDDYMFYKRACKFHKLTEEQVIEEFKKEKIEKKEVLDKIKKLVKEGGIDPNQVPVKWLKNKLTEKEWETYCILEKGI